MENHRLALTSGYQIEQFRIESVLGKGGFGITYVAMDLQLRKRVAIKELLPDSIATRVDGSTIVPHSDSLKESWQWARERFLDEARALAGFSHPAIVGVHRLIEANGTVYMVMDFVDGESYEARLKRIGTEPDQASLMAVVGPILDGLQEVHAKGLLHRDIKPENILISRRGQPILLDFGSARSSIGATMTMTSIVTHGYSPIEQYQTKGRMGPWTDIYAMGAVMCRAIAGEKPPVAADRLMDDALVWLSNRGLEGFNGKFLAEVDWALRVRPEERPHSVQDWRQQLEAAEQRESSNGSAVRSADRPPEIGNFKASCPSCTQRVETPLEMKGAWINCPTCGESFQAGSPAESLEDQRLRLSVKDLGGISNQTLPLPNRFGGITRRYFVAWLFGLFVVAIFAAAAEGENGLMKPLIPLLVMPAAFYRLKNTGMTPWWCLALWIPLVGWYIWFRCVFFPEGYSETKKLDKPAVITLIVLGVLIALSALIALISQS